VPPHQRNELQLRQPLEERAPERDRSRIATTTSASRKPLGQLVEVARRSAVANHLMTSQ